MNGSSTVQEDEIRELTSQFYVTLGAYFSRLSVSDDRAAAKRIRELLTQAERSWTHAYEIEQLLIDLYDDDTVRTELEVRALEAKAVLRPEQTALYEQELKSIRDPDTPMTPARRRVLLARLVNDLQWRYTVNEATRRYSKAVTSRAGTLFVLALAAFSVLIAYTIIAKPQFAPNDLRLFAFAALAGAWGATFSILTSLKDRLKGSGLDDLKLMRPWVMLISRALIGSGAACILYFFIVSGLLRGSAISSIFPDFGSASTARSASPDGTPMLPVDQLALLVVWCFLSGFSERMVPGLLERIESKAGNNGGAGTDRFRPTTDGGSAAGPSSRRAEEADASRSQPTEGDSGGAPPGPARG
jgi:hypothetical protein